MNGECFKAGEALGEPDGEHVNQRHHEGFEPGGYHREPLLTLAHVM